MLRIFVKLTGILPMLLYLKPRVYGRENLCGGKNVILAANHKSMLDYPLIAIVLWNWKLRVMCASSLYERSRLFAWFLNGIGCFSTERAHSDLDALGQAIDLLLKGETVLVFPEAHLSRTNVLRPFAIGAALMAVQTGRPIVPVFLDGRYGLFRRAGISFGVPIDPAPFLENATASEAAVRLNDALCSHILAQKAASFS